jgi:2-C-methyl-D-erythritol 2,4-cyclodiphosphate synthase
LAHISISVEARRPHLADHITEIRQSIASLLTLTVENVGLTATSGEGLTEFGKGEGMQALVIVSACK